jgi:succinoglycan biosynthesis protein ExoM
MPFDASADPSATSCQRDGSVPAVSVIIPTFHRPAGALAAVRSVFGQRGAPAFEVLLVDNDPSGSAVDVAERLAAEAPVAFRYAREPRAGVANARNTAVALASAPLIAFLDDDEIASTGWLAALVKTQADLGADVVFGPIEAVLGAGAAEPRSHFQAFFSRRMEGADRLLEKPWGCGNSLLVKATALVGDTPFDPAANETGGEDDLLFQGVRGRGGTFGWSAAALVDEVVPDDRASWSYLTRRAFSYGHNTTSQWFESEDPKPLAGAVSMARGLVQGVVMAPVAGLLWLARHERRAWAYDKMLRGFGKLLWFGPFKQAFYGQAELERIERRKAQRRQLADRRGS